jgi:hypothetical protein
MILLSRPAETEASNDVRDVWIRFICTDGLPV